MTESAAERGQKQNRPCAERIEHAARKQQRIEPQKLRGQHRGPGQRGADRGEEQGELDGLPPRAEGRERHDGEQDGLHPGGAQEGERGHEGRRRVESAERRRQQKPSAPQRRARQICCREQQEIVDGAVDRKGRVEIDGHRITSYLPSGYPWTKYSAAGAKNRSQSLPGLRPVVRHFRACSAGHSDGRTVAQDLPDVLFSLAAREHDLVPAAEAAEAEVHPGAHHFPALVPAGVRLFHDENILNANIHKDLTLLPRQSGRGGIDWYS